MLIRRMTEDDLCEVDALYVAAWKVGYKGLLPHDFLGSLTSKIVDRSPKSYFFDEGSFVIFDGERIAAHVHARPAAEEKMRGWGEIHTMYALPQFWGMGHAGELFDYAVDWLHVQGFDKVYLYVLEGNERAARFYKKHGFTPTDDTLDCEVGGTTVTDIRYTKEL